MSYVNETPVKVIRGKTISTSGRIKKGQSNRQLVTLNDNLKFALAHPISMVRVLEKSVVGGGITTDDNGGFRIRIEPTETTQAQLELDEYYYEVEIVEGDTGAEYPVLRGMWSFIHSPHAQ